MSNINFTPRLAVTNERVEMSLSPADSAKIGRGRDWTATVTDTLTGKRYKVKGASCGSPACFCDAIASEISDKPKQPETIVGLVIDIRSHCGDDLWLEDNLLDRLSKIHRLTETAKDLVTAVTDDVRTAPWINRELRKVLRTL